ncbi:MAG TPA: RnfABCDGE type electron transport complex subunit D [Candidatus Deferrimicrobium sp.]|nr:RnfABCDGE type electron transport complex subunit D [Candidatus Deferrimicrobium sp.]
MARDMRVAALWRFAVAITVFNILGHLIFGFEQSIAQPLVSLAATYSMEIILELISARAQKRPSRLAGGFREIVEFLLPAHITGLAVGMLLYASDTLWPIIFAAAVAIGSKAVFRVIVAGRARHFLNPSNTGIVATLLLFPWVGIAPPYHFSENLTGAGDWVLPGIILASGSFLNARFTRRIPLIVAWVGTFALQAVVRSLAYGTPLQAPLMPLTGVAFVLFTFYMVTDPGTTPSKPRHQIAFGAGVAIVYGLLQTYHVVFGLFFALVAVCAVRGAVLHALSWRATRAEATERVIVAASSEPVLGRVDR